MLSGAIGVVVARNPVHSALMLVMTLFGVAVLFVLQRDPFLAAVQVIVYAGAIVVLFLFVIMFLGVDREENIALEPLRGQRPLAIGLVVLGTTGLLLLGEVSHWTTGATARGRGGRRGAVQRLPAGQVGVHDLSVPLRGHRGTVDHRRGRRRGAGPTAPDLGVGAGFRLRWRTRRGRTGDGGAGDEWGREQRSRGGGVGGCGRVDPGVGSRPGLGRGTGTAGGGGGPSEPAPVATDGSGIGLSHEEGRP